jgi:hypothetical protein
MSFFYEPPYAAATVSDPPSAIAAALLELSHLPMLFAVVYAFNARHYRLAVTGLSSLVVSMLYHACRSSLMCLAIPVGQWRILDHTFVLWVLGEIGLHLLMGSLAGPRGQAFFLVVGYLVYPVGTLAVLFFPYSAISGLIMLAVLVLAGLVRLFLWLFQDPKVLGENRGDKDYIGEPQGASSDQFTLECLIAALGFIALGYVFYSLEDGSAAGNSTIDCIAHIIWHICSGAGLLAASASTSYRTELAIRERSSLLLPPTSRL